MKIKILFVLTAASIDHPAIRELYQRETIGNLKVKMEMWQWHGVTQPGAGIWNVEANSDDIAKILLDINNHFRGSCYSLYAYCHENTWYAARDKGDIRFEYKPLLEKDRPLVKEKNGTLTLRIFHPPHDRAADKLDLDDKTLGPSPNL